ncbi:MAG: hypothetical protein HZA28_01465 [Candidatus Omnitrophica bacterium]|nr:hypothetical protein [Candidatus Omnitrophota bacterium]
MSKLIDALNKVREAREEQAKTVISAAGPAPAAGKRYGSPGLGGAIPSILLVIVAATSIVINVKTLTESRDVRETMSLSLAQYMSEQKSDLAAIREGLTREEAAKKAQERQVVRLESELKQMRTGLENLKSAAARIEDLKINNKLLLEKFVALNDKVKKLDEMSAVNGKE